MAVMILGSNFTSCSITSCFAVYLVYSFTDVISIPFMSSLNEGLSIDLKFWILWGISATEDISICGGVLSFNSSYSINLHHIFVDFYFYSFLNATIASDVLACGWGPIFNSTTISCFVHAHPQLMSHPCVSCFTIRDASGRFSAEFHGAICLMNFTIIFELFLWY